MQMLLSMWSRFFNRIKRWMTSKPCNNIRQRAGKEERRDETASLSGDLSAVKGKTFPFNSSRVQNERKRKKEKKVESHFSAAPFLCVSFFLFNRAKVCFFFSCASSTFWWSCNDKNFYSHTISLLFCPCRATWWRVEAVRGGRESLWLFHDQRKRERKREMKSSTSGPHQTVMWAANDCWIQWACSLNNTIFEKC